MESDLQALKRCLHSFTRPLAAEAQGEVQALLQRNRPIKQRAWKEGLRVAPQAAGPAPPRTSYFPDPGGMLHGSHPPVGPLGTSLGGFEMKKRVSPSLA